MAVPERISDLPTVKHGENSNTIISSTNETNSVLQADLTRNYRNAPYPVYFGILLVKV
jgi:hypothetical protein